MNYLILRWQRAGCLSIGCLLFSLVNLCSESRADDPRESRLLQDLPREIAAEAVQRGFALSCIQRQGDRWVACIKANNAERTESCVVLGQAAELTPTDRHQRRIPNLRAGDTLHIEQYGQPLRQTTLRANLVSSSINCFDVGEIGQFVRTDRQTFSFDLKPGAEARVALREPSNVAIDSLPRFHRENPNVVRTKDLKLVQEYVDSHPAESFVVLVTVPALCEPCRQMDAVACQALSPSTQNAATLKVFILEYATFANAEQELLGPGAWFPTTLLYGPASDSHRDIVRIIGNAQGLSIAELSRPLRDKLQRGAPHTMSRGLLSKDTFMSLCRSVRVGT